MVSLGCSKNQVDAERLLFSLRQAGFALSGNPEDCDVVIINTCAFIEDAKKESIDTIFEFAAQKGKGKLKGLVVTGCMPERYREEFVRELPGVTLPWESEKMPTLWRRSKACWKVRQPLPLETRKTFLWKEGGCLPTSLGLPT